jgi:TatD DNase family protein
MDIYDSHTHLNQWDLYPQWKELVSEFINLWGKWLVNAWAYDYNKRGLTITKESKTLFPNCRIKCSLWAHPCDIEETTKSIDEIINEIRELYKSNTSDVVAIGECWIDLHFWAQWEMIERQKELFDKQCQLAKEFWIPIMIHSRDWFQETFDILKNYTDLTVYIHCWWYDEPEIKILLDTFPNLFIGFCWNTTYPKAENLRRSAKLIPIEKLLIETDAPYLSPQWHRWEKNSPARVKLIWEFIAQLRWISEEQLRKIVEKNFYTLYQK